MATPMTAMAQPMSAASILARLLSTDGELLAQVLADIDPVQQPTGIALFSCAGITAARSTLGMAAPAGLRQARYAAS